MGVSPKPQTAPVASGAKTFGNIFLARLVIILNKFIMLPALVANFLSWALLILISARTPKLIDLRLIKIYCFIAPQKIIIC